MFKSPFSRKKKVINISKPDPKHDYIEKVKKQLGVELLPIIPKRPSNYVPKPGDKGYKDTFDPRKHGRNDEYIRGLLRAGLPLAFGLRRKKSGKKSNKKKNKKSGKKSGKRYKKSKK